MKDGYRDEIDPHPQSSFTDTVDKSPYWSGINAVLILPDGTAAGGTISGIISERN